MEQRFLFQIFKTIGIGLLYMFLLIIAQISFQTVNNINLQIIISVILAILFPIAIYFLNIYFFRFLNCTPPPKTKWSTNIIKQIVIGVFISLLTLYIIGLISFLQTGKTKDLIFEIFQSLFFFNLITAIGEEIIFRGTLLYFFKKKNNTILGLIITAIFFSLIHLLNVFAGQEVLLIDIINLLLAGLFLGLIYLNFGLFASIGAHYTWNLLNAGSNYVSNFYTTEWVIAIMCLILFYRFKQKTTLK